MDDADGVWCVVGSWCNLDGGRAWQSVSYLLLPRPSPLAELRLNDNLRNVRYTLFACTRLDRNILNIYMCGQKWSRSEDYSIRQLPITIQYYA